VSKNFFLKTAEIITIEQVLSFENDKIFNTPTDHEQNRMCCVYIKICLSKKICDASHPSAVAAAVYVCSYRLIPMMDSLCC